MMLNLLFWLITLSTFGVARWLSGSWKWGYIAGGLVYGAYNEVLYEFCWSYSPVLGPFVWRDVSLMVIVGWAGIGSLAMATADALGRRLKLHSRHPGPTIMAFDIAIYCAFGVTQELAMSRLGYWTYNFPIQGWFPFQLAGYIGVACFVTSLGRRLEYFRKPR